VVADAVKSIPVILQITPKPLTPAAYFNDIYVGDPGPVFDRAYYDGEVDKNGFDLAGIIGSDEENFNWKNVALYTPYKQGSPAGTYGIYARSGYYDVNGNLVGDINTDLNTKEYYDSLSTLAVDTEIRSDYVDGGNYVIDGSESRTVDGERYVRIGSFKVIPTQGTGVPPYSTPTPTPTPEPEPEPEPERPDIFTADHIKYIYGYPDGLVKPERNLTRAEAAAVFFRLLSDGYRAGVISRENAFSDVNPGDWFNTEVSTLVKAGILDGYPDGSFRPNGIITRAELASIAARFAAIMRESGEIDFDFSDVSGHWAEADVYGAAKIGWIEGYPDGSFKPDGFITRAEFVTLVNRMLRRAPETADDLLPDTMKTWPDNTPDKWYYLDMQEATNAHEYERKDKRVPNRDYSYEKWTRIVETPDEPPDEP
jgi:hypothetical protein